MEEAMKLLKKQILSVVLFFLLVLLAFGSDDTSSDSNTTNNSPSQKQWFQGGTLHNATFAEWKKATYQNRLATAADFLASTTWKGHLNSKADFDKIKVKAAMLVKGINGSVPEGSEFMKVNEIAAALVTMSNDLGPDK
jgi:hypothetical protein